VFLKSFKPNRQRTEDVEVLERIQQASFAVEDRHTGPVRSSNLVYPKKRSLVTATHLIASVHHHPRAAHPRASVSSVGETYASGMRE